MNNLCAEIGWKSINHEGEQLCGDHVDIIEQDENSFVKATAPSLSFHMYQKLIYWKHNGKS